MKLLEQLQDNWRRISVVRELYESLKMEFTNEPSGSPRHEHLEVQLLHTKERILKLTMKNKEILKRLEVKCNV